MRTPPSPADFILPEFCKPCLFLASFQFAKIIVPYRKFPDKQDIPFETVESEIEQKETVSSTLELLTEKQRDLLIYYYVMGYKLKEIANIMHLNPKNVSMDLQRARKAALTVLKKGENVDET